MDFMQSPYHIKYMSFITLNIYHYKISYLFLSPKKLSRLSKLSFIKTYLVVPLMIKRVRTMRFSTLSNGM